MNKLQMLNGLEPQRQVRMEFGKVGSDFHFHLADGPQEQNRKNATQVYK